MTQLLSVEGLVAGYQHRPVLYDVSLQVSKGVILGVIGPNGHGKSTLLRALSGQIPAREGTVSFGNCDVTHASVHERVSAGLIQVPQGDQLFVDMSVQDNLLMGAYLEKDRKKHTALLEEVFHLFPKLADRRWQTANSLSGGERRMVGIGRGLMSHSKLLMIDEPSLGLAPVVIEQIYDALKELSKSGTALLIVEESPERLVGFADSLCLFESGQVVWEGSGDQAETSPHIQRTYLGA